MAPSGGFPFIRRRRQQRRRLLRSGLRCTAPALCGADDTLAPPDRPYFFRPSLLVLSFSSDPLFLSFFTLLLRRLVWRPGSGFFQHPREEYRQKSSGNEKKKRWRQTREESLQQPAGPTIGNCGRSACTIVCFISSSPILLPHR